MDIIKRWLKLKKAQRVRNPWALATALNQGRAQGRGNSGTSKGAYKAGIDRNEWNSPDGMEAATERSADYHGMSSNVKEGHKYSSGKKKNNNKAVSAKDKAGTKTKGSKNFSTGQAKPKATTPKTTAKTTPKTTPKATTPTKIDVKSLMASFEKDGRYNNTLEEGIKKETKKPISQLDGYKNAKPAKRKEYTKTYEKANDAAKQLKSTTFQDDKKAFKSLLKPIADLQNLKNELGIKKSFSSSRRLLNILKESVTVDNDQLEKDFTSALNQAMQKHKKDFSVPTGNNEILKGVKNKQEPKDVTKIMDLPNFTKVKNAPQLKKAGITDALIAMLAGYKLTPKVNPGEMTAAQQRQWERTLQNQMRKKNLQIDKDAFKQLQNFYKDKSDTYTRKKPAKNGVKVEKVLTSPPFQGAEFDPVSHRWKKPGEVAAKTGQVNVGTGGKRRIRGAGTGAAQRSVGGHSRGIRRQERLGVTGRATQKNKKTSRSARIKAFKTITRKR
jgi:hypothetical protein